MEEIKDNIVHDAFYLIELFHNEHRTVTQIHIQKLMFLFEAYYMNKYQTDKLYDCDYKAWDFGPVTIPLYKHFKKYGKDDIKLTNEEIEKGNEIDEKKKESLREIYEVFKEYSAMQLVNFTHAEGSPWKEAWTEQKYSIISKKKMKKWFEKYVS